jgi:hypothetical protein
MPQVGSLILPEASAGNQPEAELPLHSPKRLFFYRGTSHGQFLFFL